MFETDYLFARPSFIGGMSSVLDLGATLQVYNNSPSTNIADARAIMSDWVMTGNDIHSAISLFTEENDD